MGKQRGCAKQNDLKGGIVKRFVERFFLNYSHQERRGYRDERDAKGRKDKGCGDQDRCADIVGVNIFVGDRIELYDQRNRDKCSDIKKRIEKRLLW
ncbi:MAG: hypothetical protein JOZ51_18470 [Chloroflexi bacterium]|nr:hypothetical protein [Chloroflexota bacterium]